jgi:hypothetical protein
MFFTLLEPMEMTLKLEGKARRRAPAKTRQLRHETRADTAPAASSTGKHTIALTPPTNAETHATTQPLFYYA